MSDLKPKRRVLISAGDLSGDLLLSKVLVQLREQAAQAGQEIEFVGLAGEKCEEQGAVLLARSEEVAVVGIVEVLSRLKHIFKVLGRLGAELDKVDSVICVDFPDFNFKLAQIAKKKGKPVDYLVSPQIWAWRGKRVEKMRSLTRKVYPVLPFEETYLREHGVNALYLGHPLRDILPPRNRRESREELGIKADEFVMALLPGSRHSEIKRHLSILIRSWKRFTKEASRRHFTQRYRAVLPMPKDWNMEKMASVLGNKDREIFESLLASQEWRLNTKSWVTLQAADFGWIASGTATLEAAYYQLPHILFYRLSWLSARMIRSMTSYFTGDGNGAGLPNILLAKRVIPEILQNDFTPERLSLETLELQGNQIKLTAMKRELRWIPKKLGEAGVSARMAEDLWALWTKSRPA